MTSSSEKRGHGYTVATLLLIAILLGLVVILLMLSSYQLLAAREWFYDTRYGYYVYHELLNISYDSREERIIITLLSPVWVFLTGLVLSAVYELGAALFPQRNSRGVRITDY